MPIPNNSADNFDITMRQVAAIAIGVTHVAAKHNIKTNVTRINAIPVTIVIMTTFATFEGIVTIIVNWARRGPPRTHGAGGSHAPGLA